MKKLLMASLCLLPLAVLGAESASSSKTSNNAAPPARITAQSPGIAAVSSDEAMKALFGLLALLTDYNKIVEPLGDHYQPFSLWAAQTRNDLQALLEHAKLGKTPAEIVSLSHKAKPQFQKAVKTAQAVVPLDEAVYYLNNQIAQTSDCLAKRQAALQQADAKMKTAIQFAMSGLPAGVASLNSLVAEARAVCP